MRIAILTTNLQPNNGWATLAVKRGAALMELGVEVIALTGVDDAPPQGIKPSRVHRVLPSRLARGRAAWHMLRINPLVSKLTSDCDLIDAVAEPAALACVLASRRSPLVVTAHGTYIPLMTSYGVAQGLYRWLYRRAHILAVSDYTARRIGAALSIPAPEVILSGVDNAFFQAQRPPPDKHGPTVLCVGAPKKRKGTHVLVDAIAQVRRSIPDIQCVIIGAHQKQRYVRALRRRIGELNLDDHVHLLDKLPFDEVVGWYQAADVFALPSLSDKTFEGFGLVLLEANACGLPAIGTRDSGNESAIVNGETGFLIEQNDPEQLAQRIIAVLQDHALRDRLSRAARAFAAAHDWSASAAHLLEFYQRVLDGKHYRK
jgi:glycosyltransferase involved in cell wall biosynthesis